jgi:hypothetical protein
MAAAWGGGIGTDVAAGQSALRLSSDRRLPKIDFGGLSSGGSSTTGGSGSGAYQAGWIRGGLRIGCWCLPI